MMRVLLDTKSLLTEYFQFEVETEIIGDQDLVEETSQDFTKAEIQTKILEVVEHDTNTSQDVFTYQHVRDTAKRTIKPLEKFGSETNRLCTFDSN